MIWSRQRQSNALRSMLRDFYPTALTAFGEELAGRTHWRCWRSGPLRRRAAASPTKIAAALRRAGRQRHLKATAASIQAVLRAAWL